MKKIQCFTLLPQNISNAVVLNATLIEDTSATLTHHQGVQKQSAVHLQN